MVSTDLQTHMLSLSEIVPYAGNTKVNGRDATRKDVMVLNAIRIVTEGNASDSDFLKAFALIRDTIGEQPVQRVEVDTIDPQARAEMDELLGLGE